MTAASHSLPLELIVGIGNPGSDYANTRHNAGVWFVESVAREFGGVFRAEKKFFGKTALISIASKQIRLLIPETYMNESGKSVAALANFFKVEPTSILVAHDEIDFPSGKVRFKQGGGLAGHNGLRDISRCLAGRTDFNRLRLGVGHPGSRDNVTGHVLGKTSAADREIIDVCINESLAALPLAAAGDWQDAMQRLHNTEQPFEKKNEDS